MGPVAAVAAALENMEMIGKFHYPQTSVGDVEKEGIRKDNL